MKTIPLFRTLLLVLLLAAAGNGAMAQTTNYEPYDFREVNVDGDTLYYRITSDSEPYTVAVTRCHDSTYHTLPHPSYEWQIGQPGFVYPVYDYDSLLNIPSSVTHEGVTYTVTAVDNEAFYYQRGIREVNLPATIETIDEAAFYLSSLSRISVQEGVQCINYGAFVDTEISEIHLPQSLLHIGAFAFGYTNISRVDLPSNIDTLRRWTYIGCPIERVVFHEGLVVIEDEAFPGQYIDSLVFPSTLQYLGGNFAVYTYPDQYTSYCKYAEFRNGSNPLVLGPHCFEGCLNLETLVLSDNIVGLGEYCFSYCSIDTVVIPRNVSIIPAHCFSDCDSLRSVILPEHLDTIKYGAFRGCPLLRSIVLPADLKYIERYALDPSVDSTGLEAICVLSETPPVLQGINVFPKNWPITCTIPCRTMSTYQNGQWGVVYTNITFVEDCSLVDENPTKSIKIYPNPASDIIHIEGLGNGNHQIYVYDMQGKVVGSAKVSDNSTDINITHLPEGMYIVKIDGTNNGTYGIKVCKK